MSKVYHFEVDESLVPGTALIFFYKVPHSNTHTTSLRFDDYCLGAHMAVGKYRLPFHPRNEEYNLEMCILGYLHRIGRTVDPHTLRLGVVP